LREITYARNENKNMEIQGIPLHLNTLDAMLLNEGDIFSIIQQVPTMKLCDGSCKETKGVLKYMYS